MIIPSITTKINTRRKEGNRLLPDRRIGFKDLEDSVLSLFSKGKINTPKDLEIAKLFLSQYQEMADPTTQIGVETTVNCGVIGNYLAARSKKYDTLTIAIGTEVCGDFIFGRAFDSRNIKIMLGHIPSSSYSLVEKILKKRFPEKAEKLKFNRFLNAWLGNIADFNNYCSLNRDGYVKYEFDENFVSSPYVKGRKDGSIEFSYGKTDGGQYNLSSGSEKHWCADWEDKSKIKYDIEKLTNEIYQKIAQIEKS